MHTLYKSGFSPQKVHPIDLNGWIANGWSLDPIMEDLNPEAIAEQEPESKQEPVVQKTATRRRKNNANTKPTPSPSEDPTDITDVPGLLERTGE